MEELSETKITFHLPQPDRRISEADLERHAKAAWARSKFHAHVAFMWETVIPMAYKDADAGEPELYTAIIADRCISVIEGVMTELHGDDDVYDYGRFVIEIFQRIRIVDRATEVDDDE